jgi:hypothetical protein
LPVRRAGRERFATDGLDRGAKRGGWGANGVAVERWRVPFPGRS